MTFFLLNILLALAWTALTGQYSVENFFLGFIFGYLVLWVTQQGRTTPSYFRKVPRVILFLLFFLWELVVASLRVVYDILTPAHRMSPGIIALPLEAKTDVEITFLANLITLTPGTLSVEVSADRSVLFVHAMYIDDVEKVKRHLKNGFERRLLEIFR